MNAQLALCYSSVVFGSSIFDIATRISRSMSNFLRYLDLIAATAAAAFTKTKCCKWYKNTGGREKLTPRMQKIWAKSDFFRH